MTSWPGTPDLPAVDVLHAYLAVRGRGREHAVTQADLAIALGWPVRDVQAATEALRRTGIAICSGNEGLWLTDDPDELRDQYRRLRRRALRQLANLRQMLRTAEAMERPLTLWKDEAA